MLVLPWSTLFFMPKKDIKRWMPAALFIMVTTTIIVDVGVRWKVWETYENIYPLSEMISFTYGALPIGAMWILKFTYGRFWLYASVQVVFSLVFILFVLPFLHRRGIFVWLDTNALGGIGVFTTTVGHFISLYLYQLWQDEALVLPERNSVSANLQPAAAKPLPKDQEDKTDK